MNPETSRLELRNHFQISGTTIYGRSAVFFSLPFLGAGIFIILLGLGVIPSDENKFHVSRGLVASFGMLFFLAGVSLLIHGLLSILKQNKVDSARNERPGELWYSDYPWDPTGIKGRGFEQLMKRLYACAGITVFLIPFHWLAFIEAKILIFQISIGLFELILFGVWLHWFYLLFQYLKHGRSYLRFDQFPFFLGEKLKVYLESSRPIRGLKELELILRCVQEAYETRGSGENRRMVVVSYQIFAEKKKFDDAQIYQQDVLRLPVEFQLPADKEYAGSLSARPPRFWEIEVKAQTPGIDYRANFFVPVYVK